MPAHSLATTPTFKYRKLKTSDYRIDVLPWIEPLRGYYYRRRLL